MNPAESAPSDLPATRVWRIARHVVFDELRLELRVDDRAVELDHRPLELLRLLLQHSGEVVTKDEILEALWPGRVVTENSLTKCVGRLRQALGDVDVIRTVHGYGYRLVADLVVQSVAATPRAPSPSGHRVGDAIALRPHWHLLERLGDGGQSEVWVAEHDKTHERRVFKFALDAAQLTGLKREITLFRLLNQTLGAREDFVRVLDWNLDEAPYFIESAYSADGNLQRWAERRGGLAGLPLTLRLGIAARIADALAAAHSVGVLHKDLKPTNVLVDGEVAGEPRIRLSDFGSARLLDGQRLDQLGITRLGLTEHDAASASSGTPLYLAPELLAGQPPTVQADLYALGVMLYQLVVGDLRRPFAPGWEADVGDELLREDIAAAAAGDVRRRLSDASALAQRLRDLDARREQRVREHRAAAENRKLQAAVERARARRGLLTALIGTLLVGCLTSTWLFLRAETASRRAESEARSAQAVTQFLTRNLLSAANPLIGADPNIRVRELLGPATDELQQFQDPLPRAAIADAIGQAYAGLSEPTRAQPLLEAALAARLDTLGSSDPLTQATRLHLIDVLGANNQLDALRRTAQDVLDAAGPHPDPALELAARRALLSADCATRKTHEACLQPEQALLAELKTRLGDTAQLTLDTELDLAFDLADAQRFDEALPIARAVVDASQRTLGADHLLTVTRERQLAAVLNQAGHYDEAIAVLTSVRSQLLRITGSESRYSVTAANDLAFAYLNTDRVAEALPLFELGARWEREHEPGDSPQLARSLNNQAMAQFRLDHDRDAVKTQQQALAISERLFGPDHPDSLTYAMNLAVFEDGAGDRNEAERRALATVERARSTYTNGQWDRGWYELKAGKLMATHGKRDEARALLEAATKTLSDSLGSSSEYVQDARQALDALGR